MLLRHYLSLVKWKSEGGEEM